MDTDSKYIALADESIDGLVRADRRAHFFRHRSQWLPAECCDEHEDDYVRARIAGRQWTVTEWYCFARKAFDKRTPWLFKVEFVIPGTGDIYLDHANTYLLIRAPVVRGVGTDLAADTPLAPVNNVAIAAQSVWN